MSTEENEMTPDEIAMKIQALADNELPEQEIDAVLETIQGSYEYRSEYVELLKLKRRLGTGPAPRVSEEWLARAERRVSRRVSRSTGTLLFLGSYIVLFGYALFTLFRDPSLPLMVAVLVTVGVGGAVVLLTSAIADRVRERKTDKYREIIR